MKSQLKKIGILGLLAISLANCNSTPDSVSGTTAPATQPFLFINSTNSAVGNQCNNWKFMQENTAGAGFAAPISLRNDNFAPSLLMQTTSSQQCSAYNKTVVQGAKRYAVSTGERVVVYNASMASPPPPAVFPFLRMQAMEFVNGDFFIIQNNKVTKRDIFNMNVIVGFGPLAIPPTGKISNLCYNGNFMYVIEGGILYKIDTTGAGSISTGTTVSSSLFRYEGLEYINTTACPNTLYAVKRGSTTNSFVKIDPMTGSESVVIASLTFPSDNSRISSSMDYTTEFYYLYNSNGQNSGTSSRTIIDLTPTSGTITAPVFATAANNYIFGLQFKD